MVAVLFLLLLSPLLFAQNTASPAPSSANSDSGWKKMPLQTDSRIGFRSWHQLVYDAVQHKVLAWMAVSGCDDPWSNALWAYDVAGNTFTRESWDGAGDVQEGNCKEPIFLASPPSHPGDRHPYHQMTYDTLRGRLWIFGGVSDYEKCDGSGPGNCDYLDTWYFDSHKKTWTCTDTGGGCNAENSRQASPGHRTEGAMAYDASQDVIVFFGSLAMGNPTNDTWHYSPSKNAWKRVAQGGPPARNGDSLVYDSADRKIVLFGGRGFSGRQVTDFNDLWLYNTARKKWTNPHPPSSPPPAKFPALDYDDHRNLVIYYRGPGSLWAYSVPKNRWFQLDVSGGPVIELPAGTSMTYDSGTDTFVLIKAEHQEVWQLKLGPLLDLPNQTSRFYISPGPGQTNWFHFYVAGAYSGDLNWKHTFEWYLQRVNRGYPYPFAEYGSHMMQAVVDLVLNPPPQRLVSVPLRAAKQADGSYLLSWTVPAGAVSYRLKYSPGKEIVDWIGFDPGTNKFIGDPNRTWAWFACADVSHLPPLASPGSSQIYVFKGDPGKDCHVAMKAYVQTEGRWRD